jgi:hypothetical protein
LNGSSFIFGKISSAKTFAHDLSRAFFSRPVSPKKESLNAIKSI